MPPPSQRRVALPPTAGLLLVVIFWAGNFTATKVAFSEIGPLAFTALRFAMGSLIFWWVLRRVEGPGPALPAPVLRKLILLGVLGNTVYQLFFVEGLMLVSATKSALILAILPVAVTAGAGLFRIEHVAPRQWYAVVIATIGVVMVLLARGGSIGGGLGLGDALLFGAVVAWAGYTLLLRRWVMPLSPLRVTAWTVYTGTPILVLAAIPELLGTDWGAISYIGWGGLAYSTLLSLVAGYIIWNRAVIEVGASQTAVFNCLVPFIAALIAALVLQERPALLHVLGGLLIVSGVLVAQRKREKGEGRREK